MDNKVTNRSETIKALYGIFQQYPYITTDTRNCIEGSIFFALKGASFNGNEYALKAIEQGCAYAVVDEQEYAKGHENVILVEDVLKTLQDLANYHRQKFKIPVIGITGTNGKTTTKELVYAVLSQSYKVLCTKGNLNNHIGVPLTLLQITKEHEIAVIEMGANHVGEINLLAEIAEPTFGLITNIGHAHLEGFGSFANIVKTKGELYEYIRNRKEGKIFLDHENDLLKSISEGIIALEYGVNNDDLFVVGNVVSNNPCLTFSWRFSQDNYIIYTHLIGEYNLSNALAAITIGKYFGVKSTLICKAIEEYIPTNNRSQLQETNYNQLIVDTYNANPTSMLAALTNFSKMNFSNTALILGDMRELGDDAVEEHKKILSFIDSHKFDKVFLVGDNFDKVKNGYPTFKTVSDFKNYLSENPLQGYCILIKGSRGIELEKCIDQL